MIPIFLPAASAGGSAGLAGSNWICLVLGLAGLGILFLGFWKAVACTMANVPVPPSPPPPVPPACEPEPAALLSDFLPK